MIASRPRATGERELVIASGEEDVIIESSDIDVDALEAGGRAAVLSAFSRLLRALDMPLHIAVLIRRHPPAGRDQVPDNPPGTPTDATLTAVASDRADHWRDVDHTRVAFNRRIFFILRRSETDAVTLSVTRMLVTTCLRAGDIRHHELSGEERGRLLAECVVSDHTQTKPAAVTWRESPGHATVGDMMLRGEVLTRLPGIAVHPGWLRPILTVQAETDIALHIRPVRLDTALRLLGRHLLTLHSNQLLRAERGAISDAVVDSGADAAHGLRTRLAANTSRPLMVSMTAVARARERAELDRATAVIRGALRACGAKSRPMHLQHMDAARACWPVRDSVPVPGKLVDSVAAATCIPWMNTECDDPGGYRVGRSATGLPAQVAPFSTESHPNANVVVLARSGQGKSYTIGALVIEAAIHSIESIIIDPEGEYAALATSLGGHSITLAPGAGAALNIFDVAGDLDRAEEIADAQSRVVNLIAILAEGPLLVEERAIIEAAAAGAIATARAINRAPVLSDCLEGVPGNSRLAITLRRFCEGPLGELFSRPTTMPLEGGVIDLNLRDLKREFVAPATFIIAEWLWALVRRSSRRRHLIFDEVGLLYEHEALRTLLVQLARRCRKYDTSLIVATQNAGDLLRSADGTVVATNPSIALLGGHRGAELATMEAAFSLTADQRRYLEGAGRGEFLLLAGNRRLAVEVEVPPAYHDLLVRR